MSLWLISTAVVYFLVNLLILGYFDRLVDKPYMDEIFHVPQAQHYCAGNYSEWNDKITTLPGLYLLSTSVLRLISLATGDLSRAVSLCSLFNLRLSNVVLSTLNFIVLGKIFSIIMNKKLENNLHSKMLVTLTALTMSLFPLNYFFQFMYYTDTGSTLFVMLAYYFQLNKNYWAASYIGLASIVYRQTNVIWVGFNLCLLLLSNMDALVAHNHQTAGVDSAKKKVDSNTLNAITQNRNKKHAHLIELVCKTPNEAMKDFNLLKFLNKFYREDLTGKRLLFAELPKVFDWNLIHPYMFIMSIFLFFVFVNHGIVVGDRDNHQAGLHLVQIFYFYTFAMGFSFSTVVFSLKKLRNLSTFLSSHSKVIFLAVLPIMCVIVKNFTYEHPFLLADNRHYTFYLWARVFKRHEMVKYALTSVYLMAGYLFYRNLTLTGKSLGWLVCFTLCLIAALVPQKLIEFRYFILPYFIYRLNINQVNLKEILVELLFYSLVNLATVYVFLNKTFYWPDDPVDLQRFMW